jgi:hypothetical protein
MGHPHPLDHCQRQYSNYQMRHDLGRAAYPDLTFNRAFIRLLEAPRGVVNAETGNQITLVGRLRMALAMKAVARIIRSFAGRPVKEQRADSICPSGVIETSAASSSNFYSNGPTKTASPGNSFYWSTWANCVTTASGVSCMIKGLPPQFPVCLAKTDYLGSTPFSKHSGRILFWSP